MSTTRRLSIPTHGAAELLLGLALLALGFGLGLGPAALVLAVAAGTLVAGLGLAGVDSLPLRTHQAFDQAIVGFLLGCAIALGIAGESAGAVLLGCSALAELVLLAGTRWTRRR